MAHQIDYTEESDGVAYSDYKAIEESVKSWADSDPDRVFQGLTYDNINNGLRISVRVDNVTDINSTLTDMDSGVSSINTTHGTGFAPPSDSATIKPQG